MLGDPVLCGSFVVAGTGMIRATQVGLRAYGNALAVMIAAAAIVLLEGALRVAAWIEPRKSRT